MFLKKWKIEPPDDPAIPFLGIYPKVFKSGSQRDICTPTFIAALFTIAKKWKQPKCPSTDEWILKYGINILCNIMQPWKRRNSVTCYNIDEPQGHYAEWTKPVTKEKILHNSTYVSI